MIEDLFDGCALLVLLFQHQVQAQHASVVAEQQKQEIERQQEQLSEAGAAGAF